MSAKIEQTKMNQNNSTHPILLFDGVCNLCNASVNFIIDHDAKKQFRFAALQSDFGQAALKKHNIDPQKTDSLVLLIDDKFFVRSAAALRTSTRLSFPLPLLGIFLAIPAILRDPVYNFIARNRYKWFGKSDTCRIPTPELKSRFISE